MNKKIILVLVTIINITLILAALPVNSTQLSNNNVSLNEKSSSRPLIHGSKIYVDDDNTEGPWDGTIDHPYRYIQDAINVSSSNTVYVFNGTYYENIIVNRSIKLIGENKETTIIDGGDKGNVVKIVSYNNRIKSFTIRNSGNDWLSDDSGIKIEIDYSSNYLIIDDNIITGNCLGIHLNHIGGTGYNDKIEITNNIITKNRDIGIKMERGNKNIISKNYINNNKHGIVLSSESDKNIISLNDIRNNRENGIKIALYSSFNIIEKNNFITNTENAYFLDTHWNIWDCNYWDDWSGTGYYVINGVIFYPGIGEEPWKNYDFRPAEGPYNITVLNDAFPLFLEDYSTSKNFLMNYVYL